MSEPLQVEHSFYQVNGFRMHVAECGKGPPLVLLHGFPELWFSWRKLMPELSARFRVFAPDLRGFGESEITRSGYDLPNLSRDVAELLKLAGGGKPCFLAGHDWGGVIAWQVAAEYPRLVKALVAIAAPHPAHYFQVVRKSPRQFLMSQYAFFFQLPWLPERLLSARRGWLLSKIMKMSARRKQAVSDSEMETYREAWASRDSIRAGLNYYRRLARDMIAVLRFHREHKIECPVLVVWGERDWFLSRGLTRGLENFCAPAPAVRIIRNCGHWIAQEAPRELLETMTAFFKETSA